jgi:hypothetical protein
MVSIKKENSKSDVLFVLSIFFLVLSISIFIVNINKTLDITGRATGSLNLTIEDLTSINFTTRIINWSTGAVTPGKTVATLNTATGTVTNGNWTANSAGLIIENNGNQNLSIDLLAGKTAAAFVGGGLGDYQYNVSNSEQGSCNATNGSRVMGATSNYSVGSFVNVNTTVETTSGTRVCEIFRFEDDRDVIRLDIILNITSTANITGFIGDVITATATAL